MSAEPRRIPAHGSTGYYWQSVRRREAGFDSTKPEFSRSLHRRGSQVPEKPQRQADKLQEKRLSSVSSRMSTEPDGGWGGAEGGRRRENNVSV